MEKPKAAIVTITNSIDNYGNVFQNYAAQEFLSRLGFETKTIRNYSFVKRRIGGIYLIPKVLLDRKDGSRSIRFALFKLRRIRYWPEIVTESNRSLPKLQKKYDYFFCGSDQIWNPTNHFNRNWPFTLLKFAEPRQRIAFSASFGVPALNDSEKLIFKDALNGFAGISVREKSGCSIVKELTGKEPTLLLDPAMLLPRREWIKIEKPVKRLLGKKILCVYVLGERTETIRRYIDSVVKTEACIVVDVLDKNGKYYYPAPEEFLWIIHHSEHIITDSFHCTLFSILYHKGFKVFRRQGKEYNTFDRIETLLVKFGLKDNIYEGYQEYSQQEVSYNTSDILKVERKKASDFIRKSTLSK